MKVMICPTDLVNEYNNGKTLKKLGVEYGVTPGAIHHRIVKTGLPHRRRWGESSRNNRRNEGNPMWRGDNVGILPLHEWMKARKPKPELCEACGINPPFDLATIGDTYTRNPNDWEWLCRSCHMNKDGRIKNLKRGVM